MKSIVVPMVLFGLFFMFVQIHLAAAASTCAQNFAAKAAQSRNECQQSHPNSPQYCNVGYQTFMNSIPQLCKGQNRKKRSE
jgi:hypothetical protein